MSIPWKCKSCQPNMIRQLPRIGKYLLMAICQVNQTVAFILKIEKKGSHHTDWQSAILTLNHNISRCICKAAPEIELSRWGGANLLAKCSMLFP